MNSTKNFVSSLSNDELIKVCSEVLRWKHTTGCLPEGSILKKLADEAHMEIRDAEEEIISEAHVRFNDVVLLLLSENPYRYLRI